MQRFEGLDVRDRVRVELMGTDVERGSSTLPEQEEDREIEIHPPGREIDHYKNRNL